MLMEDLYLNALKNIIIKGKNHFHRGEKIFSLKVFYVQGPETPVQGLCTVVQGP